VLIDWFTVVAQIVNFLVLVALLKRFLWSRLTHAIDERATHVAGELAAAEEKSKEAQKLEQEFRLRATEQERSRDQVLADARKEADEQRAKLVQEARESVLEIERKWRDQLNLEETALFAELRKRTANEFLAAIRRALVDLSSSDLQQSAIHAFLEKLQSAKITELRSLAGPEQIVRSATDLSAETQQQIDKALQQRLGVPLTLKFETDPSLSWGIELLGNGHKIGWTPDSYLDSFEEKLKAFLEQRTESLDRGLQLQEK
jgi:F-type H+-transporting ATPase subunit b